MMLSVMHHHPLTATLSDYQMNFVFDTLKVIYTKE
jgi:hypothetical protein